mgnify:CR=1 FL=1
MANNLRSEPSQQTLRVAFIGGGNMAQALGLGLVGKELNATDVLVIDPSPTAGKAWQDVGVSVQQSSTPLLSDYNVWIFAVKPQHLKEVVLSCRPYVRHDTLVLSVAAGIRATDIAHWLGTPEQPFQRVIRCMPNTPALIQQGVTGMFALSAVQEGERTIATELLEQVGSVVWVKNDEALDAVTALSGSGPAYVFLFLEALIEAGMGMGLSAQQARDLALQTVSGAATLAAQSDSSIEQLRHNVTSEGGTTAAALQVLNDHSFKSIVAHAMGAAQQRAREMADEFSQ